jgi:glycosyltransferase involved in cell wall biosynthesis
MGSAVLASAFVSQPDLVIGTSPQFFTACAAFMVSRMRGIPFVFELRDLWPESIKAVGAMGDSAIIRFFENIELFLYRQASLIVSVTTSFKKTLTARGIDGAKIEVVTNGVDTTRFKPMPKDAHLVESLDLKDKFVAGYIGTHGMAHALETILDAAAACYRNGHGDIFQFILLGNGACKTALKAQARAKKLTNVIFLDSVPKDQVRRYWSLLDVSIIHLRKTPLFATVIPSKLFEGMGMGIPVLHGVAGESANIVREEGVGLVFEPENSQDLFEKLKKVHGNKGLRVQMQKRCLAGKKKYQRSSMAQRMLGFLEMTAGS